MLQGHGPHSVKGQASLRLHPALSTVAPAPRPRTCCAYTARILALLHFPASQRPPLLSNSESLLIIVTCVLYTTCKANAQAGLPHPCSTLLPSLRLHCCIDACPTLPTPWRSRVFPPPATTRPCCLHHSCMLVSRVIPAPCTARCSGHAACVAACSLCTPANLPSLPCPSLFVGLTTLTYPSAAQVLKPNCHAAPHLQARQAAAAWQAWVVARVQRKVRLGWWAGEATGWAAKGR